MGKPVCWQVQVSQEMDRAVRSYLDSQGLASSLSDFIEQAVEAHLLDRTVRDIQARNVDTDPGELQAIIDEAVREVRLERKQSR